MEDRILSKEERDVLILGAVHPNLKHLSNQEIGQRLGISVTRVKTLIHQACLKLGAHNRNEAILLAMRRREVHVSELLSLEELAEILSTVEPALVRTIAGLVRSNQIQTAIPDRAEPVIWVEKRQPGILTNRERDVLILCSVGLTNLEIAEKLCMSTYAVRTFLNRAFKKLGASRKADAVQLALKQSEISINEVCSREELEYYLAPLGADSIEKLAQRLEENLVKKVD